MSGRSRNSPCLCGSGRKFKHCCQTLGTSVQSVADDMPRWVLGNCREEMRGRFIELWDYERDGPEPPKALLEDQESWVLLDRPLPGGQTPARLYAERLDLPSEGQRRIAGLLADARQRLLHVTAVTPGTSFSATDLGSGEAIHFNSPKTSRELEPGLTVLTRAVLTSPPTIFGTIIVVHESWTEQLLAELENDRASAARNILRSAASFPRPAVYTPERAPMRCCQAIWQIDDPNAVLAALDDEPRLTIIGRGDERHCIVVQARRSETELKELAEGRSLPEAALTIDSIVSETPHLHGFGTFKIYEDELWFEAISEVRLAAALTEVAARVPDAELVSVNSEWPVEGGKPIRPSAQPSPEELEELIEFHSQIGGRKWIETALPILEGMTPRQAAAVPHLRPALSALYEQMERIAEGFEQQGRPPLTYLWTRDEPGI